MGRAGRYYTSMILESRAVGPFFKNGYLVGCPRTREALLVDPGDEVDQLARLAYELPLNVGRIVLTHGHVDHVSGIAAGKRLFRAPVFVHERDLPVYESAAEHGEFFGLTIEPPPPPDHFYEEGEVLTFGDCRAEVLATPGHTPGGICLLVTGPGTGAGWLFSGDTLFQASIGRTDLPGGDYDTLIASIRNVLLTLPDDVDVFPGHGPRTTIGQERRTNPFLVK